MYDISFHVVEASGVLLIIVRGYHWLKVDWLLVSVLITMVARRLSHTTSQGSRKCPRWNRLLFHFPYSLFMALIHMRIVVCILKMAARAIIIERPIAWIIPGFRISGRKRNMRGFEGKWIYFNSKKRFSYLTFFVMICRRFHSYKIDLRLQSSRSYSILCELQKSSSIKFRIHARDTFLAV